MPDVFWTNDAGEDINARDMMGLFGTFHAITGPDEVGMFTARMIRVSPYGLGGTGRVTKQLATRNFNMRAKADKWLNKQTMKGAAP